MLYPDWLLIGAVVGSLRPTVHLGQRRKVKVNGVVYESIGDCHRFIGKSRTYIVNHADKGLDGFEWVKE